MTWRRSRREAPVEHRAAAPYTDALVRAIAQHAQGGATADPTATAAVEAAAGAYGRAFAVAELDPAVPELTGATLAMIARQLIRGGECIHVIDVDRRGRLALQVAAAWEIRGGPDPASWFYRVDVCGPSGTRKRTVPAGSVLHARYATDPARPWRGVGPMEWAALTGRVHAEIEAALRDEAAGTRGHVLPVPAAPESADPEADPLAALRADVQALRGRTALVESVASNWEGSPADAPRTDWRPQRLGFNAPATAGALRSETGAAVLAACGVPPDLFAAGNAAREGWRRFLHGSLLPLAELVARELADKLERPGLSIGFRRLAASDVANRARALGDLVKAGVELGEARRLSGLD